MLSSSISSFSTFEVWSVPICSIFELSSLFPFVTLFVLITNELALDRKTLDWILQNLDLWIYCRYDFSQVFAFILNFSDMTVFCKFLYILLIQEQGSKRVNIAYWIVFFFFSSIPFCHLKVYQKSQQLYVIFEIILQIEFIQMNQENAFFSPKIFFKSYEIPPPISICIGGI